jgi:hypothetical protein
LPLLLGLLAGWLAVPETTALFPSITTRRRQSAPMLPRIAVTTWAD